MLLVLTVIVFTQTGHNHEENETKHFNVDCRQTLATNWRMKWLTQIVFYPALPTSSCIFFIAGYFAHGMLQPAKVFPECWTLAPTMERSLIMLGGNERKK